MSCPNDEALAAWAEGDRSEPTLGEHLDGCETCRRVVSSIARATQDEAPRHGPADVQLTIGERFDRYVVLDELGRGAMGTVFAAWDPRLERRVALKILGAATNESAMLAEARALARIEHPNVVKVFDVSRSGGLRFLSLELIAGTTLRQWLALEERSMPVRLEAVRAAGRGLEAAHQAGVLHRDFKPDNVLVSAAGQVSVTDFGLALRTGTPEVRSGGTRGYVAPELEKGAAATPASDQYAFAITALEVLEHGGKKAPRRVGLALRRASSDDPARRFETMGALLRELKPRWVGWVAAATVPVLLALAVGVFWAQRSEVCAGAAEALAPAWSAELKAKVLTHRESQSLDATQTRWVLGRLDQYAQSWRDAHTDACRATRVRGEQTEAMLAARMLCLDEQREALGALVRGFLSEERAVSERAVLAVEQLARPSACSSVSSLLPPPRLPPDDPGVQQRRRSFDSIRVLTTAGRYEKARPLVDALLTEVKQANDAALLPEVLYLHATTAGALGEDAKSEGIYWEAVAASRGPRSDEAAVRSLLTLLALANVHSRYREAVVLSQMVSSRLAALDQPTRNPFEVTRAARLAWSLHGLKRQDEALAELRGAMETLDRAGPGAMLGDQTAQVADTLAEVLHGLGDHANAARLWRSVYRLRALQYGPMAYRTFGPLINEALANLAQGDSEAALAAVNKAQQLAEAWGGNRARLLVACHTLRANLHLLKTDWPAAQAEIDLARKELTSAATASQHVEALSLAALVAVGHSDETAARELASRAIEKAPTSEDLEEGELIIARILSKPANTWCGALRGAMDQGEITARIMLSALDRALGESCPGPRYAPPTARKDLVQEKEIVRLEQAINEYLTAP